MKTISNHFSHVKLFDFDSHRRGPFFVLQRGVAPHDETLTEKDWILTRDGVWEPVPEKPDEKRHQFTSDAEVMQLLERLPVVPVCQ